MPHRADTVPLVTADRLLALVQAFRGRRVAVIGDLLADEFIYGRVERVSREAPVLILRYDQTIVVPGGAGNAASNAAALGGQIALAAIVGQDGAGKRLVASLARGISRASLVRADGYDTPLKTRILAGGIHSAKQQVVRIDRIRSAVPSAAVRRAFGRAARDAVANADAVLISDYGSGLVTPDLVTSIARRARRGSGRSRVPVLVDSRYDTLRYRGLTACTPNESEVEQMLHVAIDDDASTLERAGRMLLRRTSMDAVLVTRGSRGMALFEKGQPTRHIAISGSDEIADVTGAGDTVIATLTLALASGASFYEAARLANYAGGVVVMKRGTATVSPIELRDAIRRDPSA
jgi:rfaE bifunctional protein kinase chain/domain